MTGAWFYLLIDLNYSIGVRIYLLAEKNCLIVDEKYMLVDQFYMLPQLWLYIFDNLP